MFLTTGATLVPTLFVMDELMSRGADLLVVDGAPTGDIAILQDPAVIWLVLKEGEPASGKSRRFFDALSSA